MATAEIRPYEPADREQVRQLCFDTGLMGESIASQWSDEASWADMITGYYLDKEPNNTFVAAIGNKVVGYLLGCTDTARIPDPVKDYVAVVVKRGLFVRPGTAAMSWRTVSDGLLDNFRKDKPKELHFSERRWPANLQINIAKDFRGQGLGSELMSNWVSKLRLLNVSGCHLVTLTEDGTSN